MKERIKRVRKEFDLTQQEFADRIGIKRGAVANYEIGRNEPTDSVISLICREFNVNKDWLRTETGEMFKATSSSAVDILSKEYNLSNAASVMIEKFVSLKPEAQETILNYILEVAATFQSKEISTQDTDITAHTTDEADFSKLSIDEKVELYRQELEREKKTAGKSEVS